MGRFSFEPAVPCAVPFADGSCLVGGLRTSIGVAIVGLAPLSRSAPATSGRWGISRVRMLILLPAGLRLM